MHSRVHHHVACPITYGLNIALSNGILMLCANTGEGLGLVLGDTVITEHACIIDTIVVVEVLDCNSCQVPSHLFKSCFSHHSLACSHARLAFHIHKIGGSIGVKGTPMNRLILMGRRPNIAMSCCAQMTLFTTMKPWSKPRF